MLNFTVTCAKNNMTLIKLMTSFPQKIFLNQESSYCPILSKNNVRLIKIQLIKINQ